MPPKAILSGSYGQGHRVAVCEQMEDPAEAKKRGAKAVVRRDVVRLVTPGTLTEEALLDARANNFLAALAHVGGDLALAWLDMSTGVFAVCHSDTEGMGALLARLSPSEILLPSGFETDLRLILVPIIRYWKLKFCHRNVRLIF